ncbi:YobI family P-loop NTPase [Trueperella pyogenes]|uniref:YobI family P-loop NTPase n=1 Tax=Trueperella pyogenes TaxID=1661 RepID=UPI003252F314
METDRVEEFSVKRSFDLTPLTPRYIEAEHEIYVSALESALANPEIRNLALSGSYGVGKSSILRELGRRLDKRVLELSLSTLSPVGHDNIDESVPVQATTATNQIQREIVKQLLYREKPSRTPASRFHRIESFRWISEILLSLLLGFILAVIFLLAGWTAQITMAFSTLSDSEGWAYLATVAVASPVILAVRRLLFGKLHVKQFSTGAATVTLDDNSVSYFDQYLDEIIYFFEVSNRDIVIFEDIDRFDDPYIFETLRALNNLLNAAPQIKKKPIRFIYAFKDSIFAQLVPRIKDSRDGTENSDNSSATDTESEDVVELELARANRTKFFDLVIPVVPFVTHRSARNLGAQLLSEIDHNISSELVDLATRYVPDMRLLTNIRNEFLIFRDRIFSGDGVSLDLSETDLFAMMLYKSTYLKDFEDIKFGRSNLDTLYQNSRDLVTNNIRQLEKERQTLQNRIENLDAIASRSKILGERLGAYIDGIRAAEGETSDVQDIMFGPDEDGNTKNIEDLKSVEFWRDFVNAKGAPNLTFSYNSYRYPKLRFSLSSVGTALDESFDADRWTEVDRSALVEQMEEKLEKIEFLRSADFADLMETNEFCLDPESNSKLFSSLVEETLGSKLAYELVRTGHLNRNFTLYTSIFYGNRVSSAATNFIIHHVERGLMDVYFELSPDDVDVIIRECGEEALGDPALYNIAILDHILHTDIRLADTLIQSLDPMGKRQQQFLQVYLTAGKYPTRLVERLTALSPKVLLYLNQVELDDALLKTLVNVVLESLPPTLQEADRRTVDFLRQHYSALPVLTELNDPTRLENVAQFFAEQDIVIPNLEPLSPLAREVFISLNLYTITHENLSLVVGDNGSVSLDRLRGINSVAYGYVLENLDAYLKAIGDAFATVDNRNEFITVLTDVLEQGEQWISDVVKKAAPECQVSDIEDIPEEIWPSLASDGRFPTTFGNISCYIEHFGIDESLSQLLDRNQKITKLEMIDEKQKADLAIEILKAAKHLSAASRVALVANLELESYLDVELISVEKGLLFALLVKNDVIEDTDDTYERLMGTDWATRRALILTSNEFRNFMEPELVRNDLAQILGDDEIGDEIKREIVRRSDEYAKDAGSQVLAKLADLAMKYQIIVCPDVVTEMIKSGVSAESIVALLEPQLDYLRREELFEILAGMGEPYKNLSSVGRSVIKVPDSKSNCALLNALRRHGIVSSYRPNGRMLKVYRKRTV